MSSLFIKNIPSIRKHAFKYRTKMNSHELNQLQDEAFQDILDLFNKANALQKSIYEMKLSHSLESEFYQMRLQQALNRLEEMNMHYNNVRNGIKDERTLTRYSYQAYTYDDDYSALIDKNTNSITPGVVSSISKIHLYDDTYDETFVPESLQTIIGPDSFRVGEDILSIEDTDIRNAFDGQPETTWIRKVVTESTYEGPVINEVIIGLPEDIITTRLMNQITISPFPSGYIDILDIQYRSNGSWQTIPGFSDYQGYEVEQHYDAFNNLYNVPVIKNACDMKFNFGPVQTNQIKIKLRQSDPILDVENNRKIWYLGLRNVDVTYNVYSSNYTTFDMVFDFPETERNINILDVDIEFNNASVSNDKEFGITKQYFYYDSSGLTHKVSESAPFILKGHRLRIQFSTDGTQVIPNVRCATVHYRLS